MRTIYFDMDGIICDFNKRYKEIFGYLSEETPNHLRDENWKIWVENKNFELLPWNESFDNVKKLLSQAEKYKTEYGLIDSIEILSATGGKGYHDLIKKQKTQWLKSRGIFGYFDVVNFSEKGIDKAAFASPTKILIDDTKKVVDSFRKAKGIAIHNDNKLSDVGYQLELCVELVNHRNIN